MQRRIFDRLVRSDGGTSFELSVPRLDIAEEKWRVAGNVLCGDRLAVRVDGVFESEAERERILGDLCRRLNGMPYLN